MGCFSRVLHGLDDVRRQSTAGIVATAVGLGAMVPGVGFAKTNGPVQAIVADVSGNGTLLRVDRFRINPQVHALSARHIFIITSKTLIAMRDQTQGARDAALEKIGREEGWSEFGATFNYSGAASTLAEHVGQMEGLSNVNGALTELGLFMTVWQVSMDLSRGDNRAAGIDSYKGMMYYAIGKFGWSGLQISSVAILAIDIALNSFGTEAWLVRSDAWRQSYTAYYRESETAARAGELGARTQVVPDTPEQRIAKLRAQTKGGRSVNDWKILLDYYYKQAQTPEIFKSMVANEVDRYVGRYWQSDEFQGRLAGYRQTRVGVAPGTSLTDEIRSKLEAEHRARLMAMFVVKVFPEIARNAWLRALPARVARMNRVLRPALNDSYRVEVSAYGLSAPTQFFIAKPAGGKWGGKIAPGEPRRFKITKLAFLRAGLPDKVTLMLPAGPVEKPLKFVHDKATVVFGRAPAPRIIAVQHSTEGGQSCTVTKRLKSGKTATATETRPPRPALDIDMATMVDMSAQVPVRVMFGKYDAGSGQWTLASPGAYDAAAGSTDFGAPYLDDIHRLYACQGTAKDMNLLADADCSFERRTSHKDAAGTLIEVRCTAPVHLALVGAYMKMGAAMQYFSFEGPAGERLRLSLAAATRLDRFPYGAFAALAHSRLGALERTRQHRSRASRQATDVARTAPFSPTGSAYYTPARNTAERAQIMAAARGPVASALGQRDVVFLVEILRSDHSWAYLQAVPQQSSGAPIDWLKTPFAHDWTADAMSDVVMVLLHRDAGHWRAVDLVIGPTDVYWYDWIGKYHLPEALFKG